ncbi:hypothetical protein [Sphingomonas sp.]|uniref:hypothetical protein n=1 Tax=Sphingomonas sp. TaxID=28214 RepID=UPI0035C7E02B
MADQISICNQALAEIVAEPIESLNEESLGARECGRYYEQSLRSMLEAHPWGFATRRATLPISINDRPAEWAAAYALPIDVAKPLKVMSAATITGLGATIGWWLDDDLPGVTYAIENNLIYAQSTDAVLAYTTTDVNAATFPARFVDAFAFELASRIVMPIKKSREMKGDLIKQAEAAKQRAMADDLNRQPANDMWINRVQAVRDGGDFYGMGWAR